MPPPADATRQTDDAVLSPQGAEPAPGTPSGPDLGDQPGASPPDAPTHQPEAAGQAAGGQDPMAPKSNSSGQAGPASARVSGTTSPQTLHGRSYSPADFYHWSWSTDARQGMRWSFAGDAPNGWRDSAAGAAQTWNALGRSFRYAAPDSAVPAFEPQGCGARQLQNNAMHAVKLDGANGVIATTYSCIDGDSLKAVSVQIAIDTAERWSTATRPPTDGYDLAGAVAHEFGHATGWEGHYASGDPRCSTNQPEWMCPQLSPGSASWRNVGPTDKEIFMSTY